MKKIFTLIVAAAMAALNVQAQVMFADAEGNLYGDGDYMVLRAEEDPDWGEVMCPAPSLVNQGSTKVNVKLDVDIRYMGEGTSLADCFSGKCDTYVSVGKHTTASKAMAAGASLPTAIEWNCWSDDAYDYVHDYCIVKYTLYVNGTKDKTVTVEYTYVDEETDAIAQAPAAASTPTAFTLNGSKAKAGAKGIVIKNGKKMLVR